MTKLIKLTTGEEVIAEITENLDNTITLKNAVTVGMVDRGQLGFIGFPHYCESKETITIDRKFVMFMAQIDSKLETEYQSAFNKIVVPKPELKIIT